MAEAAALIIEPRLLRREQAAQWLNLSLRQFDRLKHDIPAVVCGSRQRLYDPEDLRAWATERKLRGASSNAKARKRSKSTSATVANDIANPQVAAMLAQLRQKPRASTPRLFPVGANKSSKRDAHE